MDQNNALYQDLDRILVTREEIAQKVQELGQKIAEDYAGKKRDVDDEGAKPAVGGETSGKKRQKQGKDESEEDFLKRVCCEAAEEFLDVFEQFGMSDKQAEKAVRLCVGELYRLL